MELVSNKLIYQDSNIRIYEHGATYKQRGRIYDRFIKFDGKAHTVCKHKEWYVVLSDNTHVIIHPAASEERREFYSKVHSIYSACNNIVIITGDPGYHHIYVHQLFRTYIHFQLVHIVGTDKLDAVIEIAIQDSAGDMFKCTQMFYLVKPIKRPQQFSDIILAVE